MSWSIPQPLSAFYSETGHIADDGAFILPTSDEPDPELVDRDGFMYSIKAGFGVRGASIAGSPELVPLFFEDMTTFWTDVMAFSTT